MTKIFLLVGLLNLNNPNDISFIYSPMPNIIVCQSKAKNIQEHHKGNENQFALVTKCLDFEEKSS